MLNDLIKIAIVDSYDLIKSAFSHQLRLMGFNVIIEAKDEDSFMEQICHASVPKLCLLNFDTTFIDEFTTAIRIKQQCPDVKIIAYTLSEKDYNKIEEYGIDVFLPIIIIL